MLARADTACPRRMRREFEGRDGGSDPVLRGRVRDRFLEAARNAHAELRAPTASHFAAPADLVAEEAALFERCAAVYVDMFGAETNQVVPSDCEQPTVHQRRQLRIGGWVDLTLADATGRKELRQLELWGRPPPADPLELPVIKVALLRLSRWAGTEPMTVRVADLVSGALSQRTLRVPDEIDALRNWFDGRMRVLEARIATDDPIVGNDCGSCKYVAGCPAHPAVFERAPSRART